MGKTDHLMAVKNENDKDSKKAQVTQKKYFFFKYINKSFDKGLKYSTNISYAFFVEHFMSVVIKQTKRGLTLRRDRDYLWLAAWGPDGEINKTKQRI